MIVGEQGDPWARNIAQFVLSEASVTILPEGDEMTTRHGLRLLVSEGRQEELRDDERGRPAPSVLSYVMRICVADAPEPTACIYSDANIVVVGIHPNGTTITIAGMGLAGWDDLAGLQLEFARPPQMSAHWPDGSR